MVLFAAVLASCYTQPMATISVYRNVINQVMQGEERLPSLPAITLKIRRAISDTNTPHSKLAGLIMQDPALSALIMKTANSALYKTLAPANTLNDAIRLLGREVVDGLVMNHSVKSLFVMRSAALKQLFMLSWRRQAVKTAICILLTRQTKFTPTFLPVTGCFLSEVGTLAVLSAFNNEPRAPSEQDFIVLCREYAKRLGIILLKKWQLDESYIDIVRQAGNWQYSQTNAMTALDLINLSLYHSLVIFSQAHDLPPIQQLASYNKLPAGLQPLDSIGLLQLISQHEDAIADYVALAL